ncbi:hypothetical protein QQZ08_003411 [Neonectria magnoliae]|uniref:Cell wall anchored protein n=1 Tax=Neonectria magnoliae TaxID=2732573 RepID=A0ABR1IB03_9HYPO
MRTFLPRIQAREHLVTLVLLACYFRVTVQQRDPINNFCRRWGHQTAVVDDKLYIDGGLITFSGSSSPENMTNPYFIYHDLSTADKDSGMPPPYANLSKNSTIPNVNGGILWPDDVNKRIYLFGGEFYDEKPWSFSLYGYDVLNDYWENYGSPRSIDIMGLSYGAGLSISSRGEGYYYGGWMNSATDPNWGDASEIPTSYMLKYEMDTNTWSNTTGPDDIGRAEGVMLYLPAGDAGLIIYFGGIQATSDGSWQGQPMEEIIIYDLLSGKSYTQNATGDVPEMRRRFCAGATWPDDQSSYNIYLYGGLGEAEGSSGFDDIYVLSIPTFTWVKMYPADSNQTGDFPHHSLSCNVINEAQMIVHGGFFPLTNDCDSEEQWGLHNMDLGRQNKDKSPWALYDPDKTKYVLPTDIISVVGGKSTGGATKTAPADGFAHQDLKALMTRQASAATRSATRAVDSQDASDTPSSTPQPDSGLSTGAIVGIGVGGGAVLILVLVGAWLFLRRRRGRDSTIVSQQQPMNQSYDYHHPGQTSSHFSSQGGPWSPGSSHFNTSSPPPFQSNSQTPSQVQNGPPVELPTETHDIPHVSPYTETPNTVEPKYDAHGNLWIPQVTMLEPTRSPTGSPQYEHSQPKYDQRYSPSRTPQELATEAERNAQGGGNGHHQTYYHP